VAQGDAALAQGYLAAFERLLEKYALRPATPALDTRQIMQRLVKAGAEGIILGCTEIGLLVGPRDAPVSLFDTTYLHARAVADWALADCGITVPNWEGVITSE